MAGCTPSRMAGCSTDALCAGGSSVRGRAEIGTSRDATRTASVYRARYQRASLSAIRCKRVASVVALTLQMLFQ